MVKSDDVLFDLQDGVEEILRTEASIKGGQALEVAKKVREHFRSHWGGQNIYFKKTKDLSARDSEIYAGFDGSNANELAGEYGLSMQHIYSIVKRERKKKTLERGGLM